MTFTTFYDNKFCNAKKNTMNLKNITTIISILLLLIATTITSNAQTTCCAPPDSLTVTSLTDSSFCVRWRITDSIGCDSPRAAQFQYRPVGTTDWTNTFIIYVSGQWYGTKCDTASACVKYQWRVRNICVSTDTTFTAWVSGPRFTTN